MLFLLIAGHALADYPLQNEAMATCKDRRARLRLQESVPWYYWMLAHVLVHGMVTAILIAWWTGNRELAILFGMLEAAAHFVIDMLKCEGVTNIHVDQAMHVACKVAWYYLVLHGSLNTY